MDYSLTFRFVTRTLSEDYRVYADGGARLLSDRSEFEPLRQKGAIAAEDGPCAVLFEEDERIFLVASALRRPSRDVAGRPIRFSFCQIFGSGRRERERAMCAFDRLTSGWAEAESKVGELIREVPRDGGGSSLLGEDIRFDQDAFMKWLSDRRFDSARPRPEWPGEGRVLRWTRNGSRIEYIDNRPKEEVRAESAPASVPAARERRRAVHFPKKMRAALFTAAVLALLACGAAGVKLWNNFWKEREVRLAAEERAAARSARAANEIKGELGIKFTGLLEWIEQRKASFDGRPEDIDGILRAEDLIREAEKLLK